MSDTKNGYLAETSFEAHPVPLGVVAELRRLCGEPIYGESMDGRCNRSPKWVYTSPRNSQRIVLKRLSATPEDEAVVYERVLRRCDLPAPMLRSSVVEDGWRWLLINFVEGLRPVAEL